MLIFLLFLSCVSNSEFEDDNNKVKDDIKESKSRKDIEIKNKDQEEIKDLKEKRIEFKNTEEKEDEYSLKEEIKEDIKIDTKEDIKIDTLEQEINYLIEDMTIEEKIGQLFMIDFRYIKASPSPKYLNKYIKNMLDIIKPGGILIFKENIENLNQIVEFIFQLQNYSKYPLFIAIDEEGGLVSRLTKKTKFVKLPYISKFENLDKESIKNIYSIVGKQLHSIGFNMNMAPVVDIRINKYNPVVSARTFSSDPKKVAILSQGAIEGLQENEIIPVLKHFPGHGASQEDSHYELAKINIDLETLKNRELLPFENGNIYDVPIMIGHIALPYISNNYIPATVSKKIMNILRKDLNYNGLTITDALDMKGFTSIKGELFKMIIDADIDVLLSPYNKIEGFYKILNYVKDGVITEDRINKSLKRILKTKLQNKLFKKINDLDTIKEEAYKEINNQEYQNIINTYFK